MIDELVTIIAEKSAVLLEDGDYMDGGLIYCGKCKTPRQCRIATGNKARVVWCLCKCRSEKYDERQREEEEEQRRFRVEALRVNGIQDDAVRDYRFDAADDTPALRKCRRYVNRWSEMYAQNHGLLLWGGVGTGKTFAAACVVNDLIDLGTPAMMTSFLKILSAGWDKAEIARQMREFPLLVIDDLGVERQSEYARETVYMIIDERYKSGKPLIITTNLTLDALHRPKNMDYKRIYDRVLEMCIPLCFDGESMRKAKAADKIRVARELFRED